MAGLATILSPTPPVTGWNHFGADRTGLMLFRISRSIPIRDTVPQVRGAVENALLTSNRFPELTELQDDACWVPVVTSTATLHRLPSLHLLLNSLQGVLDVTFLEGGEVVIDRRNVLGCQGSALIS